METFNMNTKSFNTADESIHSINPFYDDCNISQLLTESISLPSVAFFNHFYCNIKLKSKTIIINNRILPKADGFTSCGISRNTMFQASRDSATRCRNTMQKHVMRH